MGDVAPITVAVPSLVLTHAVCMRPVCRAQGASGGCCRATRDLGLDAEIIAALSSEVASLRATARSDEPGHEASLGPN